MSKDKELQELNNIKYKSMILNNNSRNNLSPIETNDTSNINDFLEKEKKHHTGEHWSKLDKTIKMQKIRAFVEKYSIDNNLNQKDTKSLLTFLTTSLDQKNYQKQRMLFMIKQPGSLNLFRAFCLIQRIKSSHLGDAKNVSLLCVLLLQKGQIRLSELDHDQEVLPHLKIIRIITATTNQVVLSR